MTMNEKIKNLRLQKRLSQESLGELLGVSAQAVSKWERGESTPDIITLVQLAEQFGITVNELVQDPNVLPEDTGVVQQAMEKVVERTLKRKADKNIILGLSSILVWFVALLLNVILSGLMLENSWLAFIYAIPANAIVLLSLRSAWRDFRWNRLLISMIMWGALLSMYMTMSVLADIHFWRMFLLGIPGQIAILLWFRMFLPVKKPE